MKEYDIVVVGAGPGGSSAAKTAGEKGVKVILLEEHPQVGFPRHCVGLLMKSSYNVEIRKMVDEGVMLQPQKVARVFAPGGKMLQEIDIGGEGGVWLIRREEFDKELAKAAVNAGAELVINTRVTGLLRENGQIAGVTTSSRALAEVRGKLVIVAGGSRARTAGIPKQEGLTKPNEGSRHGGIVLELAGVRGIEPGIPEHHYGIVFGARHNSIVPIDGKSCLAGFASLADFQRIKVADHPFSRKLRDAIPVRMWGAGQLVRVPPPLPKTVKDGLILVGDAGGVGHIDGAILTGRYAAEVAVEAIRDGDVTEAKLSRYEDMWKALGLDHMYDSWWRFLQELGRLPSDDVVIERLLEERVKQGEELTWLFKRPF